MVTLCLDYCNVHLYGIYRVNIHIMHDSAARRVLSCPRRDNTTPLFGNFICYTLHSDWSLTPLNRQEHCALRTVTSSKLWVLYECRLGYYPRFRSFLMFLTIKLKANLALKILREVALRLCQL